MTDIDIIHANRMEPITKVFPDLADGEDYETFGRFKAKVTEQCFQTLEKRPDGRLILVTATSPTPAGEGKTTTAIGLVDGLNLLGHRSVLAMREPSMGPVFGVKGGACGGGYAQVQPMEDINLHFMGDFHAITSANNLLCALVDNSLKFGNPLELDPSSIAVHRCLDVNDRSLRNCVIGMNAPVDGFVREEHFQITVATEIMAVVCLANNLTELRERLDRMIIGHNTRGHAVHVRDLGCGGSLVTLLKDALRPNLAQTLEHNPVLIHGGPFANIAHGCNSIRATRLALKMGAYTVTEAGFGADLGAEKFVDIKCRLNGLVPHCMVLVTSIRALKHNGGLAGDLRVSDLPSLQKGLESNFARHCENLARFGAPVVVALNRVDSDSTEELRMFRDYCETHHIKYAVNAAFAKGGEGARELAELVHASAAEPDLSYLYDLEEPLSTKIRNICAYYGATGVKYTPKARKKLEALENTGLPVCMAKTQYSFSDNPKLLGAPSDFTMEVKDISLSNGAGFVVVYLGDIMTMPGLPKVPAAMAIDMDKDGQIKGMF